MNPSTLWVYMLLVSMLLLSVVPSTESTFLLFACLLRARICPFRTTTAASSSSSG
ncbi:uncharacterized protein Dwil_GK27573 [Drosophila willistoni]|uniref:uncharacterized protein LOC26529575 n=1 Tax=Drosophila willistoni TaxID=7260 RepID=UPI000732B8AE|nr:uncharacterized protein LOC26529575 [Drosophila willistoni]KRF98029.1 uncharacterized protein Dwil_GK27573 [Drosophila willistoni]